jgi:DNA-binding PadR family transcriptional regulator
MYTSLILPKPPPTAEFYILLALARQEAHPYRIKHVVAEYSLGSVQLSDGSLHRHITRMCAEGLIEFAGPQSTGTAGQPRMHYSLGHHGRARLRQELERYKHAVAIARHADLYELPLPTEVDRLIPYMPGAKYVI